MRGRGGAAPLEFLTHRLAIVASPAVLEEYERFLETLDAPEERGDLTVADMSRISHALARLSVRIREDLIGELDERQTEYTAAQIARQIEENIEEALD